MATNAPPHKNNSATGPTKTTTTTERGSPIGNAKVAPEEQLNTTKQGGSIGNTKVAPEEILKNDDGANDAGKGKGKGGNEDSEHSEVSGETKKEVIKRTKSSSHRANIINEKKMKNKCQKCCGKVMSIIAQDAIYGSFFGPHPVSFLCCCNLFKNTCPCTRQCGRPFCVASIATKIMNFAMLTIVTLLAAFFITPWPLTWLSSDVTVVSSFYPCQSNKMIRYKAVNGGCASHAGYFMAYRCFFAFATVMLTNSVLMIRVSSTKDDPYRSKFHHGFWLYKYIYLTLLLLVYFLMVNGERDKEGVFEFVASIIGNIAHLFFGLIEIMFVLDLVELWVYENKTQHGSWANSIYCISTTLLFIGSFVFYAKIWAEYSAMRAYNSDNAEWPDWPLDNCVEGVKRYPDWAHIGLILASTSTIMTLIVATAFSKFFKVHERFPYTGWMQTGVMTLFNLAYLWSALSSSSNVHSRPSCNTGLDFFTDPRFKNPKEGVQPGSRDIYFTGAGLFHGLLCVASLLYFAFVHGPRSNTAPLSMLYVYVFRVLDRIPVYPDETDDNMDLPLGYLEAIEQGNVWDDEQVAVAQTWSFFYFMMILGSFSLMMAMTNYTDPWTPSHYNSSNIAYYCKFATILIATVIYMVMLVLKCEKIHRYGLKRDRRRRRSVKERLEFIFETFEEDEKLGDVDPGKKSEGTDVKSNQAAFQFYVPRAGNDGGKEGRKSQNFKLETTIQAVNNTNTDQK